MKYEIQNNTKKKKKDKSNKIKPRKLLGILKSNGSFHEIASIGKIISVYESEAKPKQIAKGLNNWAKSFNNNVTLKKKYCVETRDIEYAIVSYVACTRFGRLQRLKTTVGLKRRGSIFENITQCTEKDLRTNMDALLYYLESLDRELLLEFWGWDQTWSGANEEDDDAGNANDIAIDNKAEKNSANLLRFQSAR